MYNANDSNDNHNDSASEGPAPHHANVCAVQQNLIQLRDAVALRCDLTAQQQARVNTRRRGANPATSHVLLSDVFKNHVCTQ